MTTTELLDMYPAGLFQEKAAVSWEDALYKGTLVEKLAMTADEASLLQQHGFVVSERLRMNSFIEQFLDIWKKDLPVFISSDAILHAFHYYYVKILQQIETGMLVGGVTEMLQVMHGQLPELESRYGIIPIKYGGSRRMEQMLKDVDVYLTVPRKLLGEDVDPYFQDNAKVVNELLDLIRGEQLSAYPLFSENCRDIDFSQFKPRGHYTEDPVLTRYFQAMMWLGRTELYLLKPSGFPLSCSPQTIEDIQRQTIDAILLLELMELADVDYLYQEIESVLALLIGEQDNATPPQLQLLIRELAYYPSKSVAEC